jgi:hypothetical protein
LANIGWIKFIYCIIDNIGILAVFVTFLCISSSKTCIVHNVQKFPFLFLGWGKVEYLNITDANVPLYQPLMIDERLGWNKTVRDKPKYSEKICASALCPQKVPHRLPWV